MGTQRLRHKRVEWRLPEDFPERLARFQEASGLSTRALAGLLGVSPYRLRCWKHGEDEPNPAHLFAMLTIASVMGLRDDVLMCPERDLPDGIDVEALRRRETWVSSASMQGALEKACPGSGTYRTDGSQVSSCKRS